MASLVLSATTAGAGADTNLTAQGADDWAQWTFGNTSGVPDQRKSGGGSLISLAKYGSAAGWATFDDGTRSQSWTDGTPTSSGSSVDGIWLDDYAVGVGYELSFPASTATRQVKIWLGLYEATARVTAILSDGSVGNQVDSTTFVAGLSTSVYGIVTVDYAAASAGQSLTVRVEVLSAPSGASFESVNLSSATVKVTSAPPTITGAGQISSGEAFGQPALSASIAAASIASAEAFGSAGVSAGISATGVATAEAMGAPAVSASIAAAGIAAGEAFGSPGISIAIEGAGIASAESLGAPAIGVQLATAGIASAEQFGQPAVGVVIQPAGVATQEALGMPAVGAASASVIAAGIVSAEAFGSPALSVAIGAAGIASAEVMGLPVIGLAMTLVGVTGGEQFGSPALGLTVDTAGIASGQSLGAPVITTGIQATGIESAEEFGLVVVSLQGTVTSLSAQHAAWLESLARLHGLIDPLVVGPTGRGDGTAVQSVATAGTVVTLTTTAAPTGLPGPSALTIEQAGWLEALVRLHGLIDPLVVSTSSRGDGTLSQVLELVDDVVTVTREA